MDTKELVKALRRSLQWTQEQLAEAGGLKRVEVSNLESGRNKATSSRIREGLAKAAGVDVDDINAYLEGAIHLEALMLRRGSSRRPDRNDSCPSRTAAVQIMAEASFSPELLASVLAEPNPPDRTVYSWIKYIESKDADLRASHAAKPPTPPTTPPASPPRSTRRSAR